jgi:hypothetical protein
MCQYEGLNYRCGHQKLRIYKHCHFARNDPDHRCYGAWTVSRELNVEGEICPQCARATRAVGTATYERAGYVGVRQ